MAFLSRVRTCRSRPGRWWRHVAAALGAALLLAATARARDAAADEYELMAVYLYNVAKFANWPEQSFAGPGAPLNFCVLGDDPFGVALDGLAGKSVRGRPLAVRHYPRVAIVDGCHLLFVSRSERPRLDLILQSVRGLPILTVSDIEDFSERGGIITLSTRERLLRFSVNPRAAALAGVRLSSKLLELAERIVVTR